MSLALVHGGPSAPVNRTLPLSQRKSLQKGGVHAAHSGDQRRFGDRLPSPVARFSAYGSDDQRTVRPRPRREGRQSGWGGYASTIPMCLPSPTKRRRCCRLASRLRLLDPMAASSARSMCLRCLIGTARYVQKVYGTIGWIIPVARSLNDAAQARRWRHHGAATCPERRVRAPSSHAR